MDNDIYHKINSLDFSNTKNINELIKILDLEINQSEIKLSIDNKLFEFITESFIISIPPNDLQNLVNKLGVNSKSSQKINILIESRIKYIKQVFFKVNSEIDEVMVNDDIEKAKFLFNLTQGLEGQGLGTGLKVDSKTIDSKFEITLTKAKNQLTNHLKFILLAEIEEDIIKKGKFISQAQSFWDDYNLNRENVIDIENKFNLIENNIFPVGTSSINIIEACKFLVGGELNYELAVKNIDLQEKISNFSHDLNTLKNNISSVAMVSIINLINKGIFKIDRLITNTEFKNVTLGDLLGYGKGKLVYTIPGYDNKVIGIQHRGMGRSFDKINTELKTLSEIKNLGLPVTKTYGKTIHNGQPAIIMKKYEFSSKEVIEGCLNLKFRRKNLNKTSIKDLEKVKKIMIDSKINIVDLEFLIDKLGHVFISDPIGISKNTDISSKCLETIDTLIEVAKRN